MFLPVLIKMKIPVFKTNHTWWITLNTLLHEVSESPIDWQKNKSLCYQEGQENRLGIAKKNHKKNKTKKNRTSEDDREDWNESVL